MEIRNLNITFVDGVVDKSSAVVIWDAGYPHTEADYFWLDQSNNEWINLSRRHEWTLIKFDEIEKYGFDQLDGEFYKKSYAAPTSEQILIWKLKHLK
jgi:hypothetical protein